MRTVVALILLLTSPAPAGGPSSQCTLGPGDHMPKVKGVDENGKSITTAGTKGWMFVTVGASWCGPCKKELPAWDRLVANYASKATFIAVDIEDNPVDGVQFHKALGLAHLTGLYTTPSAIGAAGNAMPTTFIVDDKGVIRYVHCGFNDRNVAAEVKAMEAELRKIP